MCNINIFGKKKGKKKTNKQTNTLKENETLS